MISWMNISYLPVSMSIGGQALLTHLLSSDAGCVHGPAGGRRVPRPLEAPQTRATHGLCQTLTNLDTF